MSQSLTEGYAGQQKVTSDGSEGAALAFVVNQVVNKLATTALVKITGVKNAGELAPVGYVDVLPLVNQIDGQGKATPHGIINNLPYFRMQGGHDAFIMDPKVGDIGIAVFCSRDISTVKKSRGQDNPGSRRRYDWSDGLYIGGVLNGTPTQYVQFIGDDIKITARGNIVVTAPLKVTIVTPTVEIQGSLIATGSITAGQGTGDQVTVQHHKHAGGAVPDPGT